MNGEQPEPDDPISVNVRIDIETRIARLENEVEHKASKEDIANLKVWTLRTVIGTLVTTAVVVSGIVAGIARWLS